MFDVGWSELLLIGAVALVVIGPKDLPRAMRTLGQWVRRARLMAGQFQRSLDDMITEAEMHDLREELRRKAKDAAAPQTPAQQDAMPQEPPAASAQPAPDEGKVPATEAEAPVVPAPVPVGDTVTARPPGGGERP